MTTSYFPLRWESTGDQWWYATPIDLAAANGHSNLVNHLLHIDPNLLIKLTSLRRIRRLESVWDNEETTTSNEVARGRARVARSLLCHSLIRAGYSGWFLYTAASAGDVGFVKELLENESVAVLGEGEYGITDILYAAARSKNSEVFWLLLNVAVDRNNRVGSEVGDGFLWELMNRAVHAAARGGNLEVLKDLLLDCSDVLGYRDVEGSTVLHSASARGQAKVVKSLIETYNIIHSTDNQGNTALHVAAYMGYSHVVEVLTLASPSLGSLKNNNGDTFLHMAVAGFLSPGFHRLDQKIDLMKQLVSGKVISLEDIINVRNNEGRTVLHIAIAESIHSDVVELLMTVPLLDLNVQDIDGLTPLDYLKQFRKSTTSETLVKRIVSSEGISHHKAHRARNSLARPVKSEGIGTSPGTSFRFPDADLFLYTGNDNDSEISCEPPTSRFSSCSSEPPSHKDLASRLGVSESNKKSSSVKSSSGRWKFLLKRSRTEHRKIGSLKSFSGEGDDILQQFKVCRNEDNIPTPLRQKFSRMSTLPGNKRAVPLEGGFASPSARERFAASLMHGVIQTTPPTSCFSSTQYSPSSPFSSSSSPTSLHKLRANHVEGNNGISSSFFSGPLSGARPQVVNKHKRVSSFNKSLMNQYFCFGAQDLTVEDSVSPTGASRSCRRLVF